MLKLSAGKISAGRHHGCGRGSQTKADYSWDAPRFWQRQRQRWLGNTDSQAELLLRENRNGLWDSVTKKPVPQSEVVNMEAFLRVAWDFALATGLVVRRSGDGRQLYRHVCYSRYGDGCDAASVCGVTSAAAALGQITLNWNAATDDNTPTANIVYQVYQATSPMGQSFATPTATTQPGATLHTVTGLAAATSTTSLCAPVMQRNIDKNTIEVTATTRFLTQRHQPLAG